jgi:hypothetical protein
MNSDSLDEDLRIKALDILSELISDRRRSAGCSDRDDHGIYRIALGSLTDSLLDRFARKNEAPAPDEGDRVDSRLIARLPIATPEEVGELYEYLRGFRLESRDHTEPRPTPSRKGKRNQGLFYTPPEIVAHIVDRTLDALEIREPVEYLNVKLLDPALGTGRFLAGALDALTDRVLAAGEERVRGALEGVSRSDPGPHTVFRGGTESDTVTAVRIHILEHCLYGVDLDPIALRIARVILKKRALVDAPAALNPVPRVRRGNSLIGTGSATASESSRAIEDERHGTAYFGPKRALRIDLPRWAEEIGVLHWPLEFPEVLGGPGSGFDAVVGNPPYEIVSVKESGLQERTREQAYFRKVYRACRGKINTYRLMLERGLDLLADGRALGFIVPATLLADSSAEEIRRLVLDSSDVIEASVFPEKARVFEGVTQALLILILRKGDKTRSITPVFRTGVGPGHAKPGVRTDRKLIEMTGGRVPLLRTEEEKKLLEALLRYPPLAGDGSREPVAAVHQGEINLTTHREFITDSRTDLPLIRGEHVLPFRVAHPSPRGKRLDWVLPEILERGPLTNKVEPARGKPRREGRGRPWESERIVMGRVVNMAADRRLKAGAVPPGAFLGDMTNFLKDPSEPLDYLLGLLNSRLLNRRIKITSTNNYLSAREIGSLPIPRTDPAAKVPAARDRLRVHWTSSLLPRLLDDAPSSIGHAVTLLGSALPAEVRAAPEIHVPFMIGTIVALIRRGPSPTPEPIPPASTNLLDALTLLLFRCDSYVSVLEE